MPTILQYIFTVHNVSTQFHTHHSLYTRLVYNYFNCSSYFNYRPLAAMCYLGGASLLLSSIGLNYLYIVVNISFHIVKDLLNLQMIGMSRWRIPQTINNLVAQNFAEGEILLFALKNSQISNQSEATNCPPLGENFQEIAP